MKWLVALLVMTGVAIADPTETRPIDDQAGVVADGEEPALNDDVRALRDVGVKLAVIIVQSTGGTAIETYAIDARGRWHTGTDGAAMFILAIRDRQSRLEVNDALRAKFPDRRAQSILDNIRGYLRAADYAGAIRAVVREIRGAVTGEPIDLENPHPPVADPAVHTQPSSDPSAGYREPKSRWWIGVVVGLGVVLGIGALWASFSRKRALTLSHDGVRHQRSFVADWLWSSLKVIGVVLVGIAIIASSGGTRSSSSRSWGSSSSSSSSSGGGSRSSSGGGWSGGGASSRW